MVNTHKRAAASPAFSGQRYKKIINIRLPTPKIMLRWYVINNLSDLYLSILSKIIALFLSVLSNISIFSSRFCQFLEENLVGFKKKHYLCTQKSL